MSSLSRGSYISFGRFFLSHLPVFEIRAINHIYWILITPSLNPNTVYPPPPSYPRAPPPPSPSNQLPHRLSASAHSLQHAPLPHRRGGPPRPAPAAGSRHGGPPHPASAAAAAPRPPHAAAYASCGSYIGAPSLSRPRRGRG